MAILYSFISRGSVILCCCQTGAGDFEKITEQMMSKVSRQDGKYSYDTLEYTFHIIVSYNLKFVCVAAKEFGKGKPHAFLQSIMSQFTSSTLLSSSEHASKNQLNRDFAQVLNDQMKRFSLPDNHDKVNVLRSQVDEVKTLMAQNIESAIDRGDNLGDLLDKTHILDDQAKTFYFTTRQVGRKTWWENYKMKIVLAFGVIIVSLLLILVILFSTGVL